MTVFPENFRQKNQSGGGRRYCINRRLCSTSIMLHFFFETVFSVLKSDKRIKVIYSHNLSRCDGILLIDHILTSRSEWVIQPLMRNSELYQFLVLLQRINISWFFLLPGSLRSLGESLTPELGAKGEIDHSKVNLSNLVERKDELFKYMDHDFFILGGILHKVKSLYYLMEST